MFKYILCLSLLTVGCQDNLSAAQNECPTISVKFSPNGGAEEAIVSSINKAQSSIYIQAYSFTADNIAAALIAAKSSGVKIVVIADKETTGNPSSVIKLLHKNDIDIYIDSKHAIAHNKIMIIDGKTVLTGSYNFSKAASKHNAENSLTIVDSKLAELYMENWNLHKEHSYLYIPKE